MHSTVLEGYVMEIIKTDIEIARDNWTPLPMPDIVINRMNVLYDMEEKINSKILQPFAENEPILIDEHVANDRVEDLEEPEVLNGVPQLAFDEVDNEIEEEEQGFIIGHEEEVVPSNSKQDRAIEAIRGIFTKTDARPMETNNVDIVSDS
jgi:hypothetical protein